jgi:FMN reductase
MSPRASCASTRLRYRSRNREGVPKTLKIVGLCGSLAGNSKSRAALRTALDGAASAGAATQLLDTRYLGLPMYNPDDHEPTETAATLIESCHAADGLLWSSPLYQRTTSGALKNALDWLRGG